MQLTIVRSTRSVNKMLSYCRQIALQGGLVMDGKRERLQLGDNILRTLSLTTVT